MRRVFFVLTIAAGTFLNAEAPAPYRIANSYLLGGDGGWDYIVPEPAHHRLFIARHDRVMVVDEETGKVIGEVTGIQGAHGTAIVPGAGRGFATSGDDGTVVMFDLKDFKVLGRFCRDQAMANLSIELLWAGLSCPAQYFFGCPGGIGGGPNGELVEV